MVVVRTGRLVLLAVLSLWGCQAEPTTSVDAAATHGRYMGVGVYTPKPSWLKLAIDKSDADPDAAELIDDQAIIVVVDSQTGDVRACGDLSGYCVGMNPWRSGLAAGRAAPVRMTGHATNQGDTPSSNTVADMVS